MSRDEESSVLRFTCHHCGTHLGVDDSLAGTAAPCPKCGNEVKAPSRNASGKSDPVPGAAVTRGISGGASSRAEPVAPSPRQKSRNFSGDRTRRNRQVYPASGRMASEDEKSNFRALIKILIATSLVILVVVLVVWYLKNQ